MKQLQRKVMLFVLAVPALLVAQGPVPVCDRAPAVRDAILMYLPPSAASHAGDCARVTEADLAQIEDFGGTEFPLLGPGRISSADFQGLVGLKSLRLTTYGPQSVVPATTVLPALQLPDALFIELPSLEGLLIRNATRDTAGKTVSGPIEISSGTFAGLSDLRTLVMEASRVSVGDRALLPLSSLERLLVAELVEIPDELTGGDKSVKRVRLDAHDLPVKSGPMADLPSLRELVFTKRSEAAPPTPNPALATHPTTPAPGYPSAGGLRDSDLVLVWLDGGTAVSLRSWMIVELQGAKGPVCGLSQAECQSIVKAVTDDVNGLTTPVSTSIMSVALKVSQARTLLALAVSGGTSLSQEEAKVLSTAIALSLSK